MGDDRGARYEEEDVVVYRASALGGCPKALAAYASGFEPAPPPPHMLSVFNEGHDLEERVLEVAGIAAEVVDRQREIELSVGRVNGKRVIIRAHMDGRHISMFPTIIEVKKFRDAFWAKWKKEGLAGFPRYEWQISVEMHELGEPAMFVIGHAVDGEIVEVDTYVLDEPPVSMAEIRAKVKRIEDAVVGDETGAGAGGAMLTCDPVQYPCPFFYLHDDDAVETRTRVEDDVLAGVATEIFDRQLAIKEQEASITKYKKLLKELMIAGGYEGEKLSVGPWRITHSISAIPERTSTTKAHEKNYVLVTKEKS